MCVLVVALLQHDAQLDYYSKRLATCSSDRTVRVYDVSGAEPYPIADITGCVGVNGGAQAPPRPVARTGPRVLSCPTRAPTKRMQCGATLTMYARGGACGCRRHEGPVWEVSWAHPKFGVLLASCSYDRQVMIHREAEGVWLPIFVHRFHESSGAVPCRLCRCRCLRSSLPAVVANAPDSSCVTAVNSIAWAPYEHGLMLACASSDSRVSIIKHQGELSLALVCCCLPRVPCHAALALLLSYMVSPRHRPHTCVCPCIGVAAPRCVCASVPCSADDNTWKVSSFTAGAAGCTSVSWAPFCHLGYQVCVWRHTAVCAACSMWRAGVHASCLTLLLAPVVQSGGKTTMRLVVGCCDNQVRLFHNTVSSPADEGAWVADSPLPSVHTDWVRGVAWVPSGGMPSNMFASCSEVCVCVLVTHSSSSSTSLTHSLTHSPPCAPGLVRRSSARARATMPASRQLSRHVPTHLP